MTIEIVDFPIQTGDFPVRHVSHRSGGAGKDDIDLHVDSRVYKEGDYG